MTCSIYIYISADDITL